MFEERREELEEETAKGQVDERAFTEERSGHRHRDESFDNESVAGSSLVTRK